MSKQIDIFEKSKKDWNKEFSSSKTRDKSFDTLSGVSQEPLYYPSKPDNDFIAQVRFHYDQISTEIYSNKRVSQTDKAVLTCISFQLDMLEHRQLRFCGWRKQKRLHSHVKSYPLQFSMPSLDPDQHRDPM